MLNALNRQPNRTTRNQSFDTWTVVQVWAKARPIPGHDPSVVRQDCCGAPIQFTAYGDVNSPWGWEIDHIRPVAHGGSDDLVNLQPLYWRNNRYKSDSWPEWACGYAA